MKNLMVRFLREEQGQDLIEYTLLLAFVCLAAAAIFIPEGQGLGGDLVRNQRGNLGSRFGRSGRAKLDESDGIGRAGFIAGPFVSTSSGLEGDAGGRKQANEKSMSFVYFARSKGKT